MTGEKCRVGTRINYKASLSQEGAAIYCFSLLCAGYVIASNSLKAKLCALLNAPYE